MTRRWLNCPLCTLLGLAALGLLAWLLIGTGLHAASAIVMGRIERTRLVKAMVTGTKERY